jgi:glucose-1-phosphate adenylyltransferase
MVERLTTTPVFILAGGAGERLSPLTEAKPKPAVSFGATHQILDFTISNCINSGLRRIFVLTQYQREHLQKYIRDTRLRLSSRFRWNEGDELLSLPPLSGKRYRGTADAVFQNLPLISFDPTDHVVIASGDHVYSMDYRALLARHVSAGTDLTIAAVHRPVSEADQFGVLDVENGIVRNFREKPPCETLPPAGDVLVSMGVYVFRWRALMEIAERAVPMETDFGRDIVPKLLHRQKIAAYDFDTTARNYWRDVGSLDAYFQTNMDLLEPHRKFDPEEDPNWPVYAAGDPETRRCDDSRISLSALVDRTSTIHRSVVSHGACIGKGAVIENCVILPDARVGENVHLRNVIVAEGAAIADNVKVGLNAHLDRTRFTVTPGGVVVVSPTLRTTSERLVQERVQRRTVSAA